jgi:putative tryptophan/tyrosine transport system substrate-binding protein
VAVLVDPESPVASRYPSAFTAEAQALGVSLHRVDATPETLDAVLATLTTSGAEALLIQGSARFHTHRQHIMDFARMHRLPTACAGRQYMEAGCLSAYSPSLVAMFRRAAIFVDKILKGTKPADLPIELPHKLELFLNFKTAEALGITFPPALLQLADEVIK